MGTTTAPHPKETRLSIRATEPQKSVLADAARAQQMSVSQFVLRASLDAAHAALQDQTQFRLPPTEWEAFCLRLDAPARDIPAVRDLMSLEAPWGG